MTSIAERQEFAAALTSATEQIKSARQALLEATERKIEAKEDLTSSEVSLILSGNYTASGKNEKEREAWSRQETRGERLTLLETERSERAAILALEVAKDERRCLEYLVRIEELGGE